MLHALRHRHQQCHPCSQHHQHHCIAVTRGLQPNQHHQHHQQSQKRRRGTSTAAAWPALVVG
eukprot:544268-Alexandrium_andersonii.AAC.1